MTTGEVINQIRIILQEPDETFYPKTELLSWINEGQLQFCLFSNWLKKVITINSVINQSDYSISDLLLKTEYVSYDNKKLTRIDIYDLVVLNSGWQTAVAGTPSYYYFVKQQIVSLYLKPDTNDKVIQIIGIAKPIVLVENSDIPEIPIEYHDALVNYGLYKAKIKDNSLQEATSFLAIFNSFVTQAKTEGKWQDRRDKNFSFYPAKIIYK